VLPWTPIEGATKALNANDGKANQATNCGDVPFIVTVPTIQEATSDAVRRGKVRI
jgi:hypothetical protein